jgi:hypothetical protein
VVLNTQHLVQCAWGGSGIEFSLETLTFIKGTVLPREGEDRQGTANYGHTRVPVQAARQGELEKQQEMTLARREQSNS